MLIWDNSLFGHVYTRKCFLISTQNANFPIIWNEETIIVKIILLLYLMTPNIIVLIF